MKKGIFQSVLLRYMISYAAIMAVLFVGVSIYMNNSYANTVRTNTVESNINRLAALRFQHEEKLDTLMSIGNQISLSYYISSFQLEEEPMKAYHIKQQLAPYAVTNDFFDQLYLIYNEDHYLYSSATSVDIDMFVEKLMRMENTPPETLRALLRSQDSRMVILPSQGVSSVLVSGVPSDMVAVFVPLRVGERFSTGSVMFLIHERKYQQMFAEEIYEPRGTYIFHGGKTLAASRGLSIADGAVWQALEASEGETPTLDIRLEGEGYLLIALHSPAYDMWYATVIPSETIQARMASYQLALGAFLLLLSIPCVLLTFYFSRRHAKPIKDLRHLFGVSSPAKDDFEAIHSGIADLVGRNESLNSRLAESLPVQKAGFVSAFVMGSFQGRGQAVEKAMSLGMDIDRPYYMVALIDAAREDETPLDIDRLIGCGEGEVAGYGAQLVAQEQYLFTVFADTKEALERWSLAVKGVGLKARGQLTVAVSNAQEDFENSGSAYLEASTALDNRFVMGNTHVLRFADVSAAAKDVTPFVKTYLEGFRKALRQRNARALDDRIHELFQYLAHTELSLFAFRVIYNNVIGTLLSEQPGGETERVDARRYYDVFTLSSCHSIDDLDEILRKLCRDILESEGEAAGQAHPLMREIIGYMNEHYQDPMLSMSAIADAYGISAARLSLEFKEVTEMNPSEYLLLLRMEKAKALLGGTELSIRDVGTAAGYYDASGFIRRFKRYTGMTPAQYRKTVAERKKDAGGRA